MKEQKKEIAFVVACINDFAKKHSLSVKNSFQYLFKYKGIQFLSENYEAEHTLPWNTILEDLTVLCGRNGGTL